MFRWISGVLLGMLLVSVLAMAPAAQTVSSSENPPASSSALTAVPLIQEGQDFYQAGQYSRSVQVWQQAHARLSPSDVPQRALVLSYLAVAHYRLGQLDTATDQITASLQLLQEHPPKTAVEQQILGQVLNTQGNLQFAAGQVAAAAATWQQAADAFLRADDVSRQLGSLINRAQAEQSLGLFGRARQTLTLVERSLAQQPADQTRMIGWQSLGNVWRAIGEFSQSRQVLEEALNLAEARSPADRSPILLSLGNTAQGQQDLEAALDFYKRAELTATRPLPRIQARLNQLRLQPLDQGSGDAASLMEVNDWLPELPDSRAAVYARINYADLLSANPADDAMTVQIFADAVHQAQRLQDRRAEAYAVGYLALFYERRQRWSEAQALNEQALQLAQTLQAADLLYRWQWQLGRVLKAQNETNQSIQAYQAAYTNLQSLRNDLVTTSPELQFSFQESIEPLYREFLDLLLTLSEGENEQRLQLARQVIESLRLAELDNFFRSACLNDQRVAIDAVDQTAAAVIHPIILADRLELILSLPDEPLRQYTVPVPRRQLEAQTRQWLRELGKPLTSPQGQQLGFELYQWLVGPLAADLSQHDVQTLVFVLDGALRNVPMAALFDGDRYLIEKYQIALAPGLQLLDPQPLEGRSLQVLAAGLTEARHGFSALEHVSAEIQEIQAKVPGQILLDQGFTTQVLQAEVRQAPFPVVHLATHGQFSSNLEETFVLAWDQPISISELRTLLRSRDDLTTRPVELLVLSACETAAGDDRATLGLAGMAVQAGARSTIASLWSLDDQSGAEFMGQFYEALMQPNVSKAAALQQTQIALLQDPNFRHPRYWAPYVLLGNWL